MGESRVIAAINSFKNILTWTGNVMKAFEFMQWVPIGQERDSDGTLVEPVRTLYQMTNPNKIIEDIMHQFVANSFFLLLYLPHALSPLLSSPLPSPPPHRYTGTIMGSLGIINQHLNSQAASIKQQMEKHVQVHAGFGQSSNRMSCNGSSAGSAVPMTQFHATSAQMRGLDTSALFANMLGLPSDHFGSVAGSAGFASAFGVGGPHPHFSSSHGSNGAEQVPVGKPHPFSTYLPSPAPARCSSSSSSSSSSTTTHHNPNHGGVNGHSTGPGSGSGPTTSKKDSEEALK
jgi:hypothetical protein